MSRTPEFSVERWDEAVNKVIELTRVKEKKFITWMYEKKELGKYFCDAKLYVHCYNIMKKVTKLDNDHFIVNAGKEGSGKSWLSMVQACLIDPTFTLERVCYNMPDYIQKLKKAKPGQAFVLDEGNLFLFSRQALSKGNVDAVKLFALMRQKNLITIINVPNFFTLDSYVREHRVDSLFYVHARGKYVAFVKQAIPIISKKGRINKQVGGHKVPYGTYWPGYWNIGLPQINDITPEEYKKHKGLHFDDFLTELEGQQKFVKPSQAAKQVPISERTIYRKIDAGEDIGIKRLGNYFVDLQKLKNSFK